MPRESIKVKCSWLLVPAPAGWDEMTDDQKAQAARDALVAFLKEENPETVADCGLDSWE